MLLYNDELVKLIEERRVAFDGYGREAGNGVSTDGKRVFLNGRMKELQDAVEATSSLLSQLYRRLGQKSKPFACS